MDVKIKQEYNPIDIKQEEKAVKIKQEQKPINVKKEIVKELHKRNFKRSNIITKGIDYLWQAELVEMDSGKLKGISKINKGFKYLLTLIDEFSKFALFVSLKDKSISNIMNAFEIVLKELVSKHTDEGREFYNKYFNNW